MAVKKRRAASARAAVEGAKRTAPGAARVTKSAANAARADAKQTAKRAVAKETAKRAADRKGAAAAPPQRGRGVKALAPRARGEGLATDATAAEIAARLAKAIPTPTCELRFHDAFELLIATILSAQSTDKMVNGVMPELLARYPNAAALAQAEQEELEAVVKRTGFFRNKAKAVRGAAQQLVAEHGGEVPRTIEALVELPGVARKTANVVLGTAYRIASGFVVDTHVGRVALRLALTRESEPQRVEQDLCARFPKESWIDLGHRFVLHGRYTCLARTPLCSRCPLNELCPSRIADADGPWAERAADEAQRVAEGFRTSGALPTD